MLAWYGQSVGAVGLGYGAGLEPGNVDERVGYRLAGGASNPAGDHVPLSALVGGAVGTTTGRAAAGWPTPIERCEVLHQLGFGAEGLHRPIRLWVLLRERDGAGEGEQ